MRTQRPLHTLAIAFGVLAVVLVGLAPTALAYNPRIPQIPFCGGPLQAYLNGIGETINVAADQVDAQVWKSSVSGNVEFTLMLESTGSASLNSIGIYNSDDPSPPPLFQVFPGAATAGWYATLAFRTAGLVVSIWDNSFPPVFQGSTIYTGVNSKKFSFYIQNLNGTSYSQDYRNGGRAQMLTYPGHDENAGDWWQCFEDSPYLNPDPGCVSDFDDAVLLLQSMVPTPVLNRTWGGLKAIYR